MPATRKKSAEQAVGRPRPEAEVEVQRVRADDGVTQRDVGVLPREFAQTRAATAAAEEQRAADGLGPQRRAT